MFIKDHEILILEDNPDRISKFLSLFNQAVVVDTVQAAISYIQTGKFKRLYLDHDLNNEAFVDSNRADCGMEVVRWIVKNKPIIPEIFIHSANRRGSNMMYAALKSNGYNVSQFPFGGQFDDRE